MAGDDKRDRVFAASVAYGSIGFASYSLSYLSIAYFLSILNVYKLPPYFFLEGSSFWR